MNKGKEKSVWKIKDSKKGLRRKHLRKIGCRGDVYVRKHREQTGDWIEEEAEEEEVKLELKGKKKETENSNNKIKKQLLGKNE